MGKKSELVRAIEVVEREIAVKQDVLAALKQLQRQPTIVTESMSAKRPARMRRGAAAMGVATSEPPQEG